MYPFAIAFFDTSAAFAFSSRSIFPASTSTTILRFLSTAHAPLAAAMAALSVAMIGDSGKR